VSCGAARPSRGLEFRESAVGGMRLLDDLLGGDRVVLVDGAACPEPEHRLRFHLAMGAERFVVPLLRCLRSRLPAARCSVPPVGNSSTHDTDLASALALARELGMPLPKRIWLFAVAIWRRNHVPRSVCREVAAGRDKLIALLERALVADAASPAVGHAVAS